MHAAPAGLSRLFEQEQDPTRRAGLCEAVVFGAAAVLRSHGWLGQTAMDVLDEAADQAMGWLSQGAVSHETQQALAVLRDATIDDDRSVGCVRLGKAGPLLARRALTQQTLDRTTDPAVRSTGPFSRL